MARCSTKEEVLDKLLKPKKPMRGREDGEHRHEGTEGDGMDEGQARTIGRRSKNGWA